MAAVYQEISNYLKMAHYRQGGTGKKTSLVVADSASPGDSDNDSDQDDEQLA